MPVVAFVVTLFCIVMMYRHAYRSGFDSGLEQGVLHVLHDVANGTVRVEEGKLKIGRTDYGLFDKDGKHLTELDIDELSFGQR